MSQKTGTLKFFHYGDQKKKEMKKSEVSLRDLGDTFEEPSRE